MNNKTIYQVLGREPVHPFPARMAPGIVLEVVTKAKKPLRILDPMMGSGTVLALACSKGHKAIGFDIDPLAVLISKVWTTAIDSEIVRQKAREVLDRSRCTFATLSSRDAYPFNADIETRRFVAYWFDVYARRQLASLANEIKCVGDSATRDALWCAFSRLIITKQSGASLAMDLAHSRPHKVYQHAPAKPFCRFLTAVDRVVKNCLDIKNVCGPVTSTYKGDARNLPIDDASIDLILTSPPYLNAIDYLRCSKFSLVWMGYSISTLRHIRATSVGTEVGRGAHMSNEEISSILAKLNLCPPIALRERSILLRYIYDIRCSLSEVFRVLTPGGQAVYVVGENTIRGTYIPNSIIVTIAASLSGLKLIDQRTRILPSNRRYLPPPLASRSFCPLDARVRKEVVLSFEKPTL